ncbi:agmatine deiminase family protein [Alkalilimnicola ehrlichii MLHE-1]|uniref:Agmatine deiminase n=1 Tax=Alkalilimnicola ehrlichii (strain ATCC BAA-1101 / DSM 17681 / MLHE-1) TaxID=187272 RepID=Q0A8P5_ALKEH|nr:agmatine deiminase [Alkalilimnicola ehrlichii MLHE-1]
MIPPLTPWAQRPRLPAEWERQAAVQLTWPHDRDGLWGDQLPAVEGCFVAMASAIAAHQPVLVVCHDERLRERVDVLLARAGMAAEARRLAVAPSNDIWARDHGPITVLNGDGRPLIQDFAFNGWGQRYRADRDDVITQHLVQQGVFGESRFRRVEWVLEGGAIDADGAGTLLTTTRCLLNDNRNPGATRAQVEQQLIARLGASRVLWLERGGLTGDDTDGHVDMLARFVDPETIVYQACDDPDDADYPELQAMLSALRGFTTLRGGGYRLVPLPWPAIKRDEQGMRLPASYANFLIINGAVLVPQYQDPADDRARAVLGELFPDREIIGIPAVPLIQQHGSVHCATMQLPAGVTVVAPDPAGHAA